MKRIVTVDAVSGNVISDWHGGVEQSLEDVAGRTHIDLTGSAEDVMGKRWNGAGFEPIPRPPQPPTVDRKTVAAAIESASTIAELKAALLPYFQAEG